MILVDTALRAREAEGRPIQVALVGAGFMAQGLANQIAHSVPGMRVAAIYARRLEQAHGICDYAGLGDARRGDRRQGEVEDAIRAGPRRRHRRRDRCSAAPSRSTCSSTSPARSSSARTSCSRRPATASTSC